jgi:hypothetical protein
MNTVVYAGDVLGPANIGTNAQAVYDSNVSTILLGLFHIGRGPESKNPCKGQKTGDIVLNNPDETGMVVISDGLLTSAASKWPGQLKQLFKTYGGRGAVSRMGCSVGGWGCEDYQMIWGNYVVNGSIASDTTLYKNFAALKQACPFIDFIDFDCEELWGSDLYPNYDWTKTLVAFGNMLKDIGFNLTLCPYSNSTDWMDVLRQLYATTGPTVVWINLQCYAGGGSNHPSDWVDCVNGTKLPGINGASFTVPGDWVEQSSGQVKNDFNTWQHPKPNQNLGLQGGFIWNYDDIIKNGYSLSAYQQAVVDGLNS